MLGFKVLATSLVGALLICYQTVFTNSASEVNKAVSRDGKHDELSTSLLGAVSLTVWHLTDSHLNLWHRADGNVCDCLLNDKAV
jgi:hypothetical protein